MKDITDFKNTEVYPLVFEQLDRIFPEYKFRKRGNVWQSPYKLNGEQPTHRRPDKTYCKKEVWRVQEQGGGGLSLLDFYAQQHNISTSTGEGFIQALKALANEVGLEIPQSSQMNGEALRAYEEKRTKLEEACERMKKALYSDEAREALAYLTDERGYSKEFIEFAELGYINSTMANEFNALLSYKKQDGTTQEIPRGVGTHFTIALPYRSGGSIKGFVFRTILPKEQVGNNKYRDAFISEKDTKKCHLFGLTGLKLTGNKERDKDITIVEGELDALRASFSGVPNVVAASGGVLSAEALQEVKKIGARRVTLLFDTEDTEESQRANFQKAKKALAVIQAQGLEAFVCYLQSEDGNKVDVDSYLQNHTGADLQKAIEGADTGAAFLYYLLARSVQDRETAQGAVTAKSLSEFKTEVKELCKEKFISQNDIARIVADAAHFTNGYITAESLQEEIDRERKLQDAARQTNEAKRILGEAARLCENNQTEKALSYLQKNLSEVQTISKETEYSSLLVLPTPESEAREEEEARARGKADIATSYYFELNGEIEPLTLPSGGLTIVGALTSHGKSTFLRSLALQVAQNGSTGDTLYFTMEEEERAVKMEFVNTFIGTSLSLNNLRSIKTYENTGENYFKGNSLQTYKDGKESFRQQLLYTGRLRVRYSEYYSQELQEAIRYYNRQRPVKCVFIDYIQKLNEKDSRKERREELASIARTFEQLAIELQIPIVFAAQLNRDTKSPVTMCAQNIGESTNIEQSAAKVVFLWNSVEKAREDNKELKDFQLRTGITLGQGGTLYARLAKNRGGIREAEAVLNFDGNTGVITQRKPTLQQVEEYFHKGEASQEPQQSGQPLKGDSNSTDCPF